MVKRKGGGKKQVLHLSEFLGDAAPVIPTATPVWNDDCPTDLSLPGLFLIITYNESLITHILPIFLCGTILALINILQFLVQY